MCHPAHHYHSLATTCIRHFTGVCFRIRVRNSEYACKCDHKHQQEMTSRHLWRQMWTVSNVWFLSYASRQTDKQTNTDILITVLRTYIKFAKHMEYKKVPIEDWGHLLNLTLTSDDLESHIIVNVSSTSNIIPSFIKIGRNYFFGKLWSHMTR